MVKDYETYRRNIKEPKRKSTGTLHAFDRLYNILPFLVSRMNKTAKKKNRKCKREVAFDSVNGLPAVDLNGDSRCCGNTWICDN